MSLHFIPKYIRKCYTLYFHALLYSFDTFLLQKGIVLSNLRHKTRSQKEHFGSELNLQLKTSFIMNCIDRLLYLKYLTQI